MASNSGLLNYLFGKDRSETFCIYNLSEIIIYRSESLTKESFKQLQSDLLEEMIELEFRSVILGLLLVKMIWY